MISFHFSYNSFLLIAATIILKCSFHLKACFNLEDPYWLQVIRHFSRLGKTVVLALNSCGDEREGDVTSDHKLGDSDHSGDFWLTSIVLFSL